MITSDSVILTLDWIPDVSFMISIGQSHVHRLIVIRNSNKHIQIYAATTQPFEH